MLNFTSLKQLANIKKNTVSSLIIFGLAAMGLTIGLSVTAQTNKTRTTEMSTQENNIAKSFELKFEDTNVTSVKKTPFTDLYEITLNKNEIVYTNAATEFTMIGNLIHNTDQRNLTQERIDELNVVDFKTFPLSQSITTVKGSGKRKIVLFEDPNCGYCKVFRKTLKDFDNITVHTFIIDILGADSTEKAQKLLCSQNPSKALDDWMLNGTISNNKTQCDTSTLQKNKALALKIGITGTPTIFLEDGTRLPGAVDAASLEKVLQKLEH